MILKITYAGQSIVRDGDATADETWPDVMKTFVLASLLGVFVSADVRAATLIMLRQDGTRQGIVRFDPLTGHSAPLASFHYRGGPVGPWGSLSLTATADRVIAQGAAFYEFDATSGHLLRRYAAHGPNYAGWAFRGVAIDDTLATRVGIPPGYYGTPLCPPGPDPTGQLCSIPQQPFPGYTSATNIVEHDVLLRRGFAPGDTSLNVIKVFPEFPVFWSGRDRHTALDPLRKRFVFLLQGTANDSTYDWMESITTAHLDQGRIGEQDVLVASRISAIPAPDPEQYRWTTSLVYDESRDALLALFTHPRLNHEQRLIQITGDGQTETELYRFPNENTYQVDAITVLPPTPPSTYTQLLPVIGEAPGAHGTYWRSDVWLFNPSDEPTTVTLQRVMRPENVRDFSIPAHGSVRIRNAMREFGGGPSGDGTALDALLITATYRDGAQLSVYSRTYTTDPDGGTYGQAIPAVPSRVGYTNHLASSTVARDLSETQSVFVLDKRDPNRFRHNFGVANTDDVPVTLRLRYGEITANTVDASKERVVTVPPKTVQQYSIEGLFPPETIHVQAPRIWVTGDRPAAVWLTMVDNKTGDGSFIPFTLLGVEPDAEASHAFPVIARTPGAMDTFWQTDAYGVFANSVTGGAPQQPEATFHPAGESSCAAHTFRLTPSYGGPAFPDRLQFWFTTFADLGAQACAEDVVHGALNVRTASWMSAFSRTYTTRDDGGTYGEILPLYPQQGWSYRHFAGIELNNETRVNLGLYNGSDDPSTITLRVYNAAGTLIAQADVQLAPRRSVHQDIRSLLGSDIPHGLYGLTVVPHQGSVWPYVSTVDNATGDPTNWW